jgi:hypothetical protein
MRIYLERSAADYGLVSVNKTDQELVSELKDMKMYKLMGGNKYDYQLWAKEIALNYVIANPIASSFDNNGFANFNATAALDGNVVTKAWDTDNVPAGSSLIIDLETIRRAYTKLRLFMSGAATDANYEIAYSDNGTDWVVVTQITPSIDGWNEVGWSDSGDHRYWKLTLTTTPSIGPYVTAVEFYEGPERVESATVYPMAQGEGTFDVVIQSNLSKGIPSAELCAAVLALLDDRRTVCSGYDWGLRVVAPLMVVQNVQITGSGVSWDQEQTVADIEAYMDTLQHGQTLYRSQLVALAVQNGADSASVITPSGDVVPTIDTADGVYEMVRAGVVEII